MLWDKGSVSGALDYRANDVDKVFSFVVNRLCSYSPELLRRDNESFFVEQRIQAFCKRKRTRIDYERHNLAFNRAFFFKNLYKNLIALSYLRSQGLITNGRAQVIDVGSGAGPFSIAWSLLIAAHDDYIKLIDTSKGQLSLAKRVAEILNLKQRSFFQTFFPHNFGQLCGLRLMSYWFCEKDNLAFVKDNKTCQKVIGEGAIVTDYSYIINELELDLSNKYVFDRWCLKVELNHNNHFSHVLREKNIEVCGCYCRPS